MLHPSQLKSISIKKDSTQILGFSPATKKDWKKFNAITSQVKRRWRQAGLTVETFAGLYFSAVGFSTLLEVRADHNSDVDVPEKVNNYLDSIDVNLKKDGEKNEK